MKDSKEPEEKKIDIEENYKEHSEDNNILNLLSDKPENPSYQELSKINDEKEKKGEQDLDIEDSKSPEDNNYQKHEEEKNNEEKNVLTNQYIINKQKMLKEEEAQKKEVLKKLQKYYDDFYNEIINNWNNNKENFVNYYSSINYKIILMLDVPCVVSNKDNVIIIFKFLCNLMNFFKDKLKTIPFVVLTFFYTLKDYEIFSRNPKNVNTNNSLNSNNDLIEDKIFYNIFKELLPEAEIESHEFPIGNNCMYKYFLSYLFSSGFNKNFITDFLSRDDLNFTYYTYFSHYAFSMLINCSSEFIQKSDYKLILVKNFTDKINFYLSDTENLLKQNKVEYLQLIKSIYDKFNDEIFGGIAYMTEAFEKNKLDEYFENFCFTLFKPCEILLKQQKLELRIIAIEHLSSIILRLNLNPQFYKGDFNDCENVLEYVKQKLVKFSQNINYFELIFGENIHEAIIERAYTLLSFLYKNKGFGTKEISDLWKLSTSKYQTISNSIISLFGKLLPEFSNEDCNTILETVSSMNYNDINETTLKLLENFFKSNQRHESLLNILYNYSNELNYYEGLSNSIINKSRKILISLLFNQIYSNDLHQCIKNCLFSLDNNYLLNTNRTIFSEIMKEFILKKATNDKTIFKLIDEKVDDFQMLVLFLDEKYSMERILMNHLLFMKKFFVFLVEKSINFKSLINEGNFDFDSLLNIDTLLSEFKKYTDINHIEDKKMEIENEEKSLEINNINDKSKSHLLPKTSKDIDDYLKIILKDYIDYFKNKLLKEKIIISNEEIINNIFKQFEFSFEKNTYQKVVSKLVNNILNIHNMGNIHFKRTLLDFLYQLFVQNSIFQGEKEIFYNFIKSILNLQINGIHLNLLSEKDMEYLYIEKISSNDILSLPFSAYEALNLFMIYINEKNGNIKYSKENKKYIDIKDVKLFLGLKTLIEFHAKSKESKLVADSLMSLTNIMEIGSSDKINRIYLLDQLFFILDFYKNKLKENENNIIEKTALRRILRLISIINKTKVTKNIFDKNDPNNILKIYVKNNFYFTNSDQDIPFQVFKGLTIKEFKDELIEKVICTSQYDVTVFNNIKNYFHQDILTLDQLKNEIRKNNLIVLFYSPKILKDEYTLAEYNIQSGEGILILNGASTSINSDANFSMTDAQLTDAYTKIKVVFEDKYSEEIMKAALYKNKGDIDNTILYIADQNNITKLLQEMEENKKNEPIKMEEITCLEENKFNYLLNILDEGDQNINTSVWSLLAEIKFPDDLIMNSIGNKFDNFFEENNLNKKILILKIINSVIFGDTSFCKYNILNKKVKNEWIAKFIKNEKFISQILKKFSEIIINENNEINISKIIRIIINWFLSIFNKINEIFKNKSNQIIDDESESNYNILEENKTHKNKQNEISPMITENIEKNDNDFGEYEIDEIQANTFIKILEDNKFIIMLYDILGVIENFNSIFAKIEKRKIVKDLYDIIIGYIEIKPKDIQYLIEEEKNKRKIVNILISLKDRDIRNSSLKFIKNLLDKMKIKNNEINIKEEEKIDVQSQLLKIYFSDLISEEVFYEEFYELYNYLINIDTVKPETIPIDKIIEKLLDYLYNFYINSENLNSEVEDDSDKEKSEKIKNKLKYNLYILNCFYPFYSQLLQEEIEKKYVEKKDIIGILYNSLFEKKQDLSYLFTDEQLRLNAFNFLLTIISLKEEYFNLILPKIISQHINIEKKKVGLPVEYPLRDFQKQKFIGLKNFGATCYLNSLLQQMYMIPTFKESLFQFNINNINNDKLDESTIYNMQITFTNLKKSFAQFYPPIKFIKSFKSAFNGEPIHVGVQQDTDEFLAILCDKLEEEAKIFNKQDFLENSFKGGISNEILSLEKDYKYYSQITEPFYRITLDIKGHKNLEEALDAYVKGEILDGENKYYCSDYNKKISVKKRTSIKFMGNEIIIHLKRFEFDFITFENNKLNDHLIFPLEINLKKWTRAYIRLNELEKEFGKNNFNYNDVITEREKENLDNDKMDFELTGILVHSGTTLQTGHYYSIIKDQESNKWYKFNDNNISEFDIEKDLEKECFGNLESKKNQYGKGAYLLFYTRKECIKNYQNFETKLKINENLIKNTREENIDFINIKTYNSNEYQKFILKFIQISLNYLSDENAIEIEDENNEIKSYDKLMNKEMIREINIYQKILELLKGNKENNIDINDDEIKIIPNNMNEIYEKCKAEIIFNEENKIKPEKNKKNISIKNIVKFLYYYTFGIIYQYNDKEMKLNECLNLLKEILEKNNEFSIFIMKSIEKNIDIFIDLLFKFGYSDKDMTGINKTIFEFYQILFMSVETYEKEKYGFITNEIFYYYIKEENGNGKFEKEYKSLYLRLFNKLLCQNLEKCRKEFLREKLFLELFNHIINLSSDSSIVASNYLIPLTSFISNNNIPNLKSEINPNFKMGNNNANYLPNPIYMNTFCKIILRCVTPGMLKSNKKSPHFHTDMNFENNNFNKYPQLPKDYIKIFDSVFFINFFLFYQSSDIFKVICHLSFYDEFISTQILLLLKMLLKNEFYYYSQLEEIVLRVFEMFSLEDGLNQLRLNTLFDFDKEENYEHSLNKFYFDIRNKSPKITLRGIYILAQVIQRFNDINKYIIENKERIRWINDFYAETIVNVQEKNNFYNDIKKLLDDNPGILEFIQKEFINKFE